MCAGAPVPCPSSRYSDLPIPRLLVDLDHLDQDTLIQQAHWVVDLCSLTGFILDLKKSCFSPREVFVFLGFRFLTSSVSLYSTKERVSSFLHSWTSSCLPQLARVWQMLLGLLAATEKPVPLGRLHMRSPLFHLQGRWFCWRATARTEFSCPIFVARICFDGRTPPNYWCQFPSIRVLHPGS